VQEDQWKRGKALPGESSLKSIELATLNALTIRNKGERDGYIIKSEGASKWEKYSNDEQQNGE
jgi:hypothetical protein